LSARSLQSTELTDDDVILEDDDDGATLEDDSKLELELDGTGWTLLELEDEGVGSSPPPTMP